MGGGVTERKTKLKNLTLSNVNKNIKAKSGGNFGYLIIFGIVSYWKVPVKLCLS